MELPWPCDGTQNKSLAERFAPLELGSSRYGTTLAPGNRNTEGGSFLPRQMLKQNAQLEEGQIGTLKGCLPAHCVYQQGTICKQSPSLSWGRSIQTHESVEGSTHLNQNTA